MSNFAAYFIISVRFFGLLLARKKQEMRILKLKCLNKDLNATL